MKDSNKTIKHIGILSFVLGFVSFTISSTLATALIVVGMAILLLMDVKQ